jgi:hypothetical protein
MSRAMQADALLAEVRALQSYRAAGSPTRGQGIRGLDRRARGLIGFHARIIASRNRPTR